MLDIIYWNADPVIFSLGPVAVRWYGLAFAIGFIAGYSIVARMFKHEGAPEKWLGILLMYLMAGTVVGARLGHVFFYEWGYYSQHPGDIFKIWEGGLASHGGTIALIIALFIFSWCVSKKPASWVFDKVVIPIAFVGGLIRLGNLMNSEIYGAYTDLPWGFVFLRNGETVPAHPTQIYEALCYFTGVFFIGIFLPRFLIEFVKNVQVSSEYGLIERYGLNMGQMLSLPFILLGVILVIVALKRPRVKFSFPDRFPDADGTSAEKKRK